MSSGFPFLQVYQWWPNSWHIGHSCFFDFFLLPPSTADFTLFFLLPPVDLRHVLLHPVHEEAMCCFGSHGLVRNAWDRACIGILELLDREEIIYMIF